MFGGSWCLVPGLLLDLGDDQFVEHVVRTSQPHGHNLTSHPLQMQIQKNTKLHKLAGALGAQNCTQDALLAKTEGLIVLYPYTAERRGALEPGD